MDKDEYVELHTSLAKMKYELEIMILEASDNNYITELRKQIDAIDEVMKIFIVEC